jgi:hypothetical protein
MLRPQTTMHSLRKSRWRNWDPRCFCREVLDQFIQERAHYDSATLIGKEGPGACRQDTTVESRSSRLR